MPEYPKDYGVSIDDIPAVTQRLSLSKFRNGFYLNTKDILYIRDKGFDTIMEHAEDFIRERIVPLSLPIKDGKQTPYKGHPVFKAQHATATCCRTCLMKYHKMPKNVQLSEDFIFYILVSIGAWLKKQTTR